MTRLEFTAECEIDRAEYDSLVSSLKELKGPPTIPTVDVTVVHLVPQLVVRRRCGLARTHFRRFKTTEQFKHVRLVGWR